MARLPNPGQDQGTWGDILNEYLLVAHTGTGSLATNSVATAHVQDNAITEAKLDGGVTTKLNQGGVIADGAITKAKLAPSVQASLDAADSALQSVTKADVGLANVDNTSDANKPISTATQTALNAKVNTTALAPVATAGTYASLTGQPTIPSTPSEVGAVPLGGGAGKVWLGGATRPAGMAVGDYWIHDA